MHHDVAGGERGWLIATGELDEPATEQETLRRFLAVAGGRQARVAILDLGGGDRAPAVREGLDALGVAGAEIVRAADDDPSPGEGPLANATGYILLGDGSGDPAGRLGGDWGAPIRHRVGQGAALAAVGSIAAILGEHRVLPADAPSSGVVRGGISVRPGAGFLAGTLVDAGPPADRLARLVGAVAQNPFAVGIAIEPGCGVTIDPGGALDVHGHGAVTVVDGASVGYSDYFAVKAGEAIGLTGVRVHLLTPGMQFDLEQRAFIYPEQARSRKRISEEAEARALSR